MAYEEEEDAASCFWHILRAFSEGVWVMVGYAYRGLHWLSEDYAEW